MTPSSPSDTGNCFRIIAGKKVEQMGPDQREEGQDESGDDDAGTKSCAGPANHSGHSGAPTAGSQAGQV